MKEIDNKISSSIASVNEIVSLLDSYSKSKLNELKQKYPSHNKLFQPGIICGESDDSVKELKIRTELCKKGLETILIETKRIVPIIKNKIKLLNNIQLISQIIISITGASIILTFKQSHGELFTMIVGVLTLLSGVLTIYTQHKSGTISLGENSLTKVFNELTDHKIKAERYLNELIIIEKLDYSLKGENIIETINNSNEISGSIQSIIVKY